MPISVKLLAEDGSGRFVPCCSVCRGLAWAEKGRGPTALNDRRKRSNRAAIFRHGGTRRQRQAEGEVILTTSRRRVVKPVGWSCYYCYCRFLSGSFRGSFSVPSALLLSSPCVANGRISAAQSLCRKAHPCSHPCSRLPTVINPFYYIWAYNRIAMKHLYYFSNVVLVSRYRGEREQRRLRRSQGG